jgi:hypothetical protein
LTAGASSGSEADERVSPLLKKPPSAPQLVLPFIPPKFAGNRDSDSSTLRPSEYLKSLQVTKFKKNFNNQTKKREIKETHLIVAPLGTIKMCEPSSLLPIWKKQVPTNLLTEIPLLL